MPLPWLRILDSALSLADLAWRGRPAGALRDPGDQLSPARAATEARLAGVVVAALKEAFDRDHQRLEFEKEQREADRRRAERLLKIEIARQAGDREVTRLRWLAAAALAVWVASIYIVIALGGASSIIRIAFGVGSALFLAALGSSLAAQSQVSASLARLADHAIEPQLPSAGGAGSAAAWLLLSGLAVIAVGVLLH